MHGLPRIFAGFEVLDRITSRLVRHLELLPEEGSEYLSDYEEQIKRFMSPIQKHCPLAFSAYRKFQIGLGISRFRQRSFVVLSEGQN